MKAEEYAMILDSIFKIKSKEIREWLDKKEPSFFGSESYSFSEGIIEGLDMAREAIEKSKFLFDRD